MLMTIEIKIINKELYNDDNLPRYATEGSAAVDLLAPQNIKIHPQQRFKVPTGLAVWLGSDWGSLAGLILPRSSLGVKGLVLANTVGLIDQDYQGEIIVPIWNSSDEIITIKKGERFAQLMVVPVLTMPFKKVEEFSETTSRGVGGFGSTGK